MAQAEKETKESLKIKKKPGRLKKLSSQENKTKTTIDLKPKEKTVQKATTTKVNVEPTEKIEEIIKEKVEDNKDIGLLSKELATIMLDVPVEFHEENFEMSKPNLELVKEIFENIKNQYTPQHPNR